jgi:hypothetical protein
MPRRIRHRTRITRESVMARIPFENQRRAELGIEPIPVEEELLMQGYHGIPDPPADWRRRRNDGTHNRPAAVKRLDPTGELMAHA